MSQSKKTLVIIGGKVGKSFLLRMQAINDVQNQYHIVYYEDVVEPTQRDNYAYYNFDPTSYTKLLPLLKNDFHQVLIAMEKKLDVETTIKNIRMLRSQLRIVFINFWDINFEDQNIVSINTMEVLSNRMVGFLPDVPILAQNVGLGSGEVMEVIVPFGSSYVYRHLGTIRQKNWRIVAMYRNNKMMLSTPEKMIQPNDRLLLVGEPPVLRSVNRAIKRQLGQFPAPFGKNIYLLVDMKKNSITQIRLMIKQAMFLHQKFPHKLFIRVINPCKPHLMEEIKEKSSYEIVVLIDYVHNKRYYDLVSDVKTLNIGLIIVNNRLFKEKTYRNILFKAHVPVLKLGLGDVETLSEAIIPITDLEYVNDDLEKISTSIYDVSSQLGLRITLMDFLPQEEKSQYTIIEHFENLSSIFSKRFHIVQNSNNPIRALQKRSNFLQCIPFNEAVLPRKWHSIFSTDMHRLYYKLDRFHQIFIPTKL